LSSKQKKKWLFRSRDEPVQNRSGGNTGFLFGGTKAGVSVSEQTAMQMTSVYACVRILSEAVASLPLHVYEQIGDGDRRRVENHPLYRILHDEPNPEMSSFVFRETLMAHLLLWGNAYAQIVRNGRGEVLALYPMLPNKMDVSRNPKTGRLVYTYRRDDEESGNKRRETTVILDADSVLHIPGLSFDGLIGYSPIAMAKNAIGMGIAAEEYGSRFFSNGATPSGVLEHPAKLSNPERLRDSWNETYGSSRNANRVAVLEEGLTFKQISLPPEQAQFLETRKFQTAEIARIFRVPPHMVGDLEKATFSNIEHQSLEFVKYTLDPWVSRWEQTLCMKLLMPNDKKSLSIQFNVDGLLRGDYQSRMNGYAIGIQNGFMSPNDVRRLENMNLIPDEQGGNLYMVNGSMSRLVDAGAAYRSGKEES
jgi:HK97 family phage portal protein